VSCTQGQGIAQAPLPSASSAIRFAAAAWKGESVRCA
jgi:hypothetical protein